MESSYLFCMFVSSSKRITLFESQGGRSSDKILELNSSFSIAVRAFSSWVDLSISFKSCAKELILTWQLSKLATSNAPRSDARVSQASQSLLSCTVTCSSVSPGFRAAPHQPNSAEVDWVLDTERLGQKASENDMFSANCAKISRALEQHLSSVERNNTLKALLSQSSYSTGIYFLSKPLEGIGNTMGGEGTCQRGREYYKSLSKNRS